MRLLDRAKQMITGIPLENWLESGTTIWTRICQGSTCRLACGGVSFCLRWSGLGRLNRQITGLKDHIAHCGEISPPLGLDDPSTSVIAGRFNIEGELKSVHLRAYIFSRSRLQLSKDLNLLDLHRVVLCRNQTYDSGLVNGLLRIE